MTYSRLGIAGLVVAVFTAGASSAGLVGPDRTAFREAAIKSCSAKQQADPSNQGIPASIITTYCTCYADRMADNISMPELSDFEKMNEAQTIERLQSRIAEASSFCAAEIQRSGNLPAQSGSYDKK